MTYGWYIQKKNHFLLINFHILITEISHNELINNLAWLRPEFKSITLVVVKIIYKIIEPIRIAIQKSVFYYTSNVMIGISLCWICLSYHQQKKKKKNEIPTFSASFCKNLYLSFTSFVFSSFIFIKSSILKYFD